MAKVKGFLKKWGKFFRDGLTGDKNKKRDVIAASAAILVLAGILFSGHFSADRKASDQKNNISGEEATEQQEQENQLEKDIVEELKMAEENTDMSQWLEYKNAWFGFSIKYPAEWKVPSAQSGTAGSKWEQRVQFRKKNVDADDSYVGYDVVVYDTSKISEIMDTQEFPALKSGMVREDGVCDTISGHVFETGDYPAEEIYIAINDNCYEPTLFFTFTKDEYTYNLVPRKKIGLEFLEDQRMEISLEMPEFFASAATIGNIDIDRTKTIAKPIVRKKVISAPKPYVFDVDSAGRKVCNKGSKDKPGKSNKGKGKHLDMECCLDPDEYPNPHCYYSPSKYGKYL